jgi:hypothetical protein
VGLSGLLVCGKLPVCPSNPWACPKGASDKHSYTSLRGSAWRMDRLSPAPGRYPGSGTMTGLRVHLRSATSMGTCGLLDRQPLAGALPEPSAAPACGYAIASMPPTCRWIMMGVPRQEDDVLWQISRQQERRDRACPPLANPPVPVAAAAGTPGRRLQVVSRPARRRASLQAVQPWQVPMTLTTPRLPRFPGRGIQYRASAAQPQSTVLTSAVTSRPCSRSSSGHAGRQLDGGGAGAETSSKPATRPSQSSGQLARRAPPWTTRVRPIVSPGSGFAQG